MHEDPDLHLVHQLRRITVLLNRAGGEFAARNGLHPTDVRALVALLDAQRASVAATPTWLGAELGLNSASVTALVDRMERLGLVLRERDTKDRRRVLLTVSDRAHELGWGFFGGLIDDLLLVVAAHNQRDRAVVRRFLDEVLAVVQPRRQS